MKTIFIVIIAGLLICSPGCNKGGDDNDNSDINTAPVANAGDDQAVFTSPVTLDGSGSIDADGNSLTYSWTFSILPSGSSLANSDITNADTDSPSFIPDVDGEYTISLIVNDGMLDSDPDIVIIDFDETQPIANAGDDQAVSTSPVNLDGSGSSDADGDLLIFTWTFSILPSGSSLNNTDITNAETASPSFDPDVDGEYTLSLIVNDGILDSDPDTVTIDFDGTPPIANAGDDQIVSSIPVNLDGSGSSDAGGGSVTHAWTFSTLPSGSSLDDSDITNADTAYPSFIPDVNGEYIISLMVNDGINDSDPNTISIFYDANKPVANAGANQSMSESPVSLDGSGSSDADGESLTYIWTFSSIPSGSTLNNSDISGVDTVSPSFVPDVDGEYTLSLIVNDGILESDSDTVTIEFNAQPVANAGVDQTVSSTPVYLNGSESSDAGGDPITYAWTFSSIPAESTLINSDIINADTASPSFIPDVDGEYIISLIVNDGILDSEPDTVAINYTNTLPVADAGTDQGVTATGSIVTLDGSSSNDVDGDSVTYVWIFSSVPAGSSLLDTDITDANTVTPEFTPDVIGAYEVTLVVNDGHADSESDTAKIVCVIADNNNGTVDIATSGSEYLTWKKCSQGQVWNEAENDCTGIGDATDDYGIQKYQYCSSQTNDCDNEIILDGSEDNGSTSGVWNECDGLNNVENGDGSFGFAGRTGWRVPTLAELEAFNDIYINYSSYLQNITFTVFVESLYWSSTNINTTNAYTSSFYPPHYQTSQTLKDDYNYVQCVTGP